MTSATADAGSGSGSGSGSGYGSGSGSGYGSGSGSGSGYGSGSGSGSGYGSGDGDGDGDGSGYGSGYGSGSGDGSGYGDGDGGSRDIPPTGFTLRAWKKAYADKRPVVVELEIPADAARSRPDGDSKCRASKAVVRAIASLHGDTQHDVANSGYDKTFVYRVGEVVEPREPFDETGVACAAGIHFYLTRAEAENH